MEVGNTMGFDTAQITIYEHVCRYAGIFFRHPKFLQNFARKCPQFVWAKPFSCIHYHTATPDVISSTI